MCTEKNSDIKSNLMSCFIGKNWIRLHTSNEKMKTAFLSEKNTYQTSGKTDHLEKVEKIISI